LPPVFGRATTSPVTDSHDTAPLTRRAVLAQAWPIVIGQATIPLVGLTDTVVIGRTGDPVALAGVALGSVVISFLFWSFGFLRMGMTGLTAQADGAEDRTETSAMLVRGVALGLGIGLGLMALQVPLGHLAFSLLAGDKDLTDAAQGYVAIRFFSAPAALASFALLGWLFGLGRTREALAMQIVMNLANIALDIGFVWGLDMGARGVAAGTAIAECIALVTGGIIALRIIGLPRLRALLSYANLFDRAVMRRIVAINFDIMIRTIALLLLIAWFTNAGARLGTVQLAANAVLNQFVALSAYVLDAFAFTAEARVGAAVGRGSRPQMERAIRLTGEFSGISGAIIAGVVLIAGAPIVDAITSAADVREAAYPYLPLVAAIPLLGMPAWLLDGIFLGATRSRNFRNAALLSTVLYIGTDLIARPWGATGLWIAFLLSYIYRAAALGIHLPGLLRSVGNKPSGLAKNAPRA